MKTPAQYRHLDQAHVWHPYTQMAEYPAAGEGLIVASGQGPWLVDVEGRRVLDGYAQMWCNVWGHGNRELADAIHQQALKIAHSSLFSASNTPAIELASQVAALAEREYGHDDLSHVMFSDNGSTAVEVALKVALQFHLNRGEGNRRHFLCFSDAYHGDTGATMTLGGVELFRRAYEPITFNVLRSPCPMQANTWSPDAAEEAAFRDACRELRSVFAIDGANLAAVVIEPAMQGAGGMRPVAAGFLAYLRELCDEYGVLLIADEVLVGFGRCGSLFASAAEGVTPDLLCLGKGLTAGMLPLALTVARKHVYEAFLGAREDYRHLFHGHTFTGNQLGCAVALKNLEMFERENLIAGVRRREAELSSRLQEFEALPWVGRCRQHGLMAGIPLVGPDGQGDDSYTGMRGRRVCARCFELGALVRPLGDVVVVMPVLATSAEDLKQLLDIIGQALEDTRGGQDVFPPLAS